MPKDLNIRASVKVEPTLENTDEMPIEYLNQDEKHLTKRQRLLVWKLKLILRSLGGRR